MDRIESDRIENGARRAPPSLWTRLAPLAHRELELGQAHVELALELGVERLGPAAVAAGRLGGEAGAGLVVLDERVEVLAEDLGGLHQRHLGAEGPGGPDPEQELVVVGPLA